MPTITGTIATAEPVDCRLLLLDPTLERSLGSVVTRGPRFTLAVPDDVSAGVVLARLRGPVFASAHARVSIPGAEVVLDPAAHAPLWPVEVIAEGDVPAELSMMLAPERIPGFPDGAAQTWTSRFSPDGSELFATWRLTGHRAAVTVQEGTWIVDASYAVPARVRGPGAGRTSWSIAAARDTDGVPLPLDGGCVRIRIDRPAQLTLTIARRDQA